MVDLLGGGGVVVNHFFTRGALQSKSLQRKGKKEDSYKVFL